MQVLFSPSSPPPSPSRPSRASQPRHMSFRSGRTPSASNSQVDDNFPPVAIVTTPFRPNSHLRIVDLTESPRTSPRPPDAPLPSFPLVGPNSPTRKTSRSRSPARSLPPSSFPGFHTSKSSPTLPALPILAPLFLAPPSRPGSPRRRATFLLPGDSDSDRDRDGECEGGSAHDHDHDDSDDSDRTSYFSAEEFVVPASVLRDAVTAGGRVLDARYSTETQDRLSTLQAQESVAPIVSEVVQPGNERDAGHELRRWHALMEIVYSEVGYVRDLRVLVNVYLSILPTLPLSPPALEAVQRLKKDASNLLELHEWFVRALEVVSAQVAGGVNSRGSVDTAVRRLSGLFVDEAPKFDLYQQFCSAQPDATRLLRPAQARTEWVTFERRCSMGAEASPKLEKEKQEKSPQDPSDTRSPGSSHPSKSSSPRAISLVTSAFKPHIVSTPLPDPLHSSKHRRHSYDSLAGVFGTGTSTIRPRPSIARPLSDIPSRSNTEPVASLQNSRLRFHDFLIKPIQRICKYPLMLEGLRSKVPGDSTDVVVTAAVESMRGVAMRVDEARRRRESAVKSKLIVERFYPHTVVSAEFLKSLGDCLLAGSVDVVHHHHTVNPISTPVRVKYLGGFLYPGGYFLLVKVGKGKIYRIKHWFSLAPFEIVDISRDTALVPFSFRLSYMDHHFEIAVACQREKDLWLRAINEARGVPSPSFSEPVSSLQILQAASSSPIAMTDRNVSTAVSVPTLKRGHSLASIGESSKPLSMLRLSSTMFRPSTSASNPSVRYIFSHSEESSILLHRSSMGNRTLVDRDLSDVMSDLVSSVRRQAQARQETLFPPPELSEISQTITLTAKNKLMRRASVLVTRPRVPPSPGSFTDRDEDSGSSASTLRTKSIATYRKRMTLLPALSVLYTEPESVKVEGESVKANAGLQFPKPRPSADTGVPPPPMTRSLTTVETVLQSAPSEQVENHPCSHRRARSLVGSVKGLMRFGSIKSVNPSKAAEACRTIHHYDGPSSDAGDSTEPGSKRSTRRRRVSSAPTSPPVSSADSVFFPDSDQVSSTASTTPDTPFPNPTPIDPPTPSVTFSTKPCKKPATILHNHDHTLKPRRSFKNFVFYNRLTAVDHA